MDYPLYNLHHDQITPDIFQKLVSEYHREVTHHVPQHIKKKHTLVRYNGQFTFIREDWDRNEEINNVTDLFTECVRINCSFANKESPLVYWNKNKQSIMSKMASPFNIKKFRDYMFTNVRFCNNFRVSVALTVLRMFNARKWLDISAGWGDRLLAAIGHGVDVYVSVDPNADLHTHYHDMINTLVTPAKRGNFIVLNDGFETAIIPKHNYDIVFSSPPFFDLEVYSQCPKDSLIAHPTIDAWYTDFLIVSLKKAYDLLNQGGHMVLYMGEGIGTKYISDMILYLNTLMQFDGAIYYYYDNAATARCMYVWTKTRLLA
jgi:tRNA1(Val) A37 N6-methylase TrmN6